MCDSGSGLCGSGLCGSKGCSGSGFCDNCSELSLGGSGLCGSECCSGSGLCGQLQWFCAAANAAVACVTAAVDYVVVICVAVNAVVAVVCVIAAVDCDSGLCSSECCSGSGLCDNRSGLHGSGFVQQRMLQWQWLV